MRPTWLNTGQIKRNTNQNVVFHKCELTFHVHVGRLVQEVHEELRGVDEDLVAAVSDGAIPPRSLRHHSERRQRGNKYAGLQSSAQHVDGGWRLTTTTGRMTIKANP